MENSISIIFFHVIPRESARSSPCEHELLLRAAVAPPRLHLSVQMCAYQ